MPVVAVTGATGFVGAAVVRRLGEVPGVDLRLLVRSAGTRQLGEPLARHRIVDGDLLDNAALERLVDGADAIVHAAAAIAGNRASDFERTNVAGTRRLAEAAARSVPRAHWIQVSSLAARAPALSWYAESKRAAEEIVQSRIRRFTLLRPPAVYGAADPALAGFWRLLARGWLVRLGPARARFSLLHVDDLAEAVARAVMGDAAGGIVTLAGPQPEGGWSWPELGRVAGRVRGAPVRTLAMPAALLRGAGAASLALGRLRGRPAVLSPGKARELLHADWVCDNLAAQRCLDLRPVTRLERMLGTLPGWTHR